ncbi:leucine-rich repeat domain-containing protein [Ekhidna sp.]|uniref:leucine-rich repeat domain-containing protein n=1 Tax=Ekhidna sp. TaxID=2608089 RepID=UPI0032972559
MRLISLLCFLFLTSISLVVFTQETNDHLDQNEGDSVVLERRKRYEATLKFIEEMRRRREKDPQGFADSIAQIKEKQKFHTASARIEEYRQSQNLNELVEIDISGARLVEIPDWIFEAKNLEILVLDNNRISVLPDRLNELSKLRRIYWRHNDLGNANVRISRLDSIEKIDLTGNDLLKLPKVHRLKGLEELVLEDNSFKKIPTWRARRLKDLKELDLSINPLEIDKRWYGLLDHIEILKLNKCHISDLHPSIYRMIELKELQIQVNDLQTIPDGISALEKLEKLSFYKNQLAVLPNDFFDLDMLKVIDFYYNQFEKIPPEIGNLKNIEILYLSFNRLYDIPGEINQLENLEELYIHHNRLSEIPLKLGELQKLKTFHFQHNYIPEFPSQILGMKNLVDLDISDTDIKSIPSGIIDLHLKNFYWRNLEINLADPDNRQTTQVLMKLMDQGTNVVPGISIVELFDD